MMRYDQAYHHPRPHPQTPTPPHPMAIPVEMPKMSDTMEEGVLVAWLAEEGDSVTAGDVIAQVETDKATMDLEVYDDGVLLKRVIGEGASVPIGSLIAVLGKEGEDVGDVISKYAGGDGATAETPEPESAPAEDTASAAPSGGGAVTEASTPGAPSGRIKASPLAKKLAQEHGLDLAQISGSGPEGRIVKRDIEAAASGGSAKAAPAQAPAAAPASAAPQASPAAAPQPVKMPDGALYTATKVSQMRKTIARRLAQSKFTAPHFYLVVDIDMEAATAFRKVVNADAGDGVPKVSFNDLITKAAATALRKHPDVNASWMEAEGEIWHHDQVNIAIAVAIPDGLVTPVIRNADRKGLRELSTETRELAGKARDKKLQPSDYEGSTFTTSNLGMFGIEEFTAIINPPNACILAIGAIREVPVVKDGAVVPGKKMKVSLSCDHRVVDGAVGAAFLKSLQGFLEDPMTMLL